MKNAAYHSATAEELLDQAATLDDQGEPAIADRLVARAQVHALLALVDGTGRHRAVGEAFAPAGSRPAPARPPRQPSGPMGTRPYAAVPR